jgi:type VI secretion system protein ImpJ
MSRYRRVVWNEGMLLSPHHFQQADNYMEDLINTRVGWLFAHEWGILDLQINRDAVANGSVQLISCRGVMPDGLIVNIPQTCLAPESRQVGDHFSPTAGSLDVYLAVPARQVGAANFQAAKNSTNGNHSNQPARFLQDAGLVIDETSGENEFQLAFARPNFKLLFDGEPREGYNVIKIAELQRTATGRLKLAEEYVPPALHIGASPWLENLLRQLIEFLVAKSQTLGERRHQSGSGQASFTTDDGMVLWTLPTLNAAIPPLAHLFHQRIVHPERLYTEMVRLAGAMMTLVFDRHAKDLPRYDHLDLYQTFRQLDFDIRFLLERVDPQRYVPIPFIKERPALYVARVDDNQLLRDAEFFLAVGAQVPESRLIERVPFAIKIAHRDGIDVVINNALSGVSMTHVRPPGQIPTRAGFHYFRLDRNDLDTSLKRFWDFIVATKTLSVWVADEFPEAKLELYAIKPQ